MALIVLLLLVLVNLLADRFHARWDLTENREYTLSPATRNVLDRLDDVVNIHVYFSKELPAYFATLDRQVKDLLDEYEAAGKGQLVAEFVDPGSDPVLEQTMQRLGIPKLQLTRYEQDRTGAMTAYLGISIQYEAETEVIPVIQSVDQLEYLLTSAIVKASTLRQTVGIATAGSPTVPEDFRGMEQVLGEQYQVRAVDVNGGDVPVEVTSLIVRDEDSLTEQALYRIDQFLMRGGHILFLAPGVNVDMSSLNATNREVKTGSLLRTYGVEVQNALVVDAQSPLVSFDVGAIFPLSLQYPWFPQVVQEGFSEQNPITRDLQQLVLPWTSPLLPLDPDTTAGAGVEREVLARSSDRSFAASHPYQINPQVRVTMPESGTDPQDLAYALTGRFPSHWKGQPVPGDSLGTAPGGAELSLPTQIVVVGSAAFLDNRFLGQYSSNAIFLANTLDWMTLGNDLIAIRSRSAASRPLKDIEDDKKGLLKTLAVVPVPVLVVLFGLVRTRLRANRRRRYAAEFKGAA